MKAIRKFAYAALLTISALSFSPATASAQDEGGHFTLPHEVRWQGVVVPAGDYRFSLQSMGPSEMLHLNKITGTPASFLLLVKNTEEFSGSRARLIIDSKSGMKYVSALELPEFSVALHFAAPSGSGKILAAMQTASAAGSAR
jgi:hypothetical protein